MEMWFGGAALVAILAACWQRVKLLASRITSLLIVRVRIEGEMRNAVLFFCNRNLRRSPFGERRFGSISDFVNPLDRFQLIGFEENPYDPAIYWKGWRPISIVEKPGQKEGHEYCLHMTFIRGMFDLDRFLIESLDCINTFRFKGTPGADGSEKRGRYALHRKFGKGKFRVFAKDNGAGTDDSPTNGSMDTTGCAVLKERRLLRWTSDDIGQQPDNPWEALAFPQEVSNLVAEIDHWLRSEKWYRQRQIPWRLGWLLHGKPGSGKTSIVRAIGQHFDLPIFVFDLGSFSNHDFTTAWRSLLTCGPCIALLEDLDAVFHGRENQLGQEGGGLTFDCLLNCISGIEVADGVFLAITTNHLEHIDPALGIAANGDNRSTRPGRIDRVVKLPESLDEDCRRRIATRILDDTTSAADAHWPETTLLIEETVEAGAGETGAQFQDRCAKIALEHHWRNCR